MEKLLQCYGLATTDLGATFADAGKLGFAGSVQAGAVLKILAPSFAQELGAGAVLFLLDAFDLLGHGGWQRDCQSIRGSHGVVFGVLLVVTQAYRFLR
jgi:hypothetical protein